MERNIIEESCDDRVSISLIRYQNMKKEIQDLMKKNESLLAANKELIKQIEESGLDAILSGIKPKNISINDVENPLVMEIIRTIRLTYERESFKDIYQMSKFSTNTPINRNIIARMGGLDTDD